MLVKRNGCMMLVGSFFSGIGGIELGFEREGFRTAWFVEIDPYARAILRKHWSTTPIYEDITRIDWDSVPRVDVITGGFPCQDISNAGKRAGITGSKSSLWKYYLEGIRHLRPRIAVIENVAALTKRGLDTVLADLASIGYDAEWYNLSASATGAFHRRERIFILAYPNSSGRIHGQTQVEPTEGRESPQYEPITSRNDVTDGNSEGLEGTEYKKRYSSKYSRGLEQYNWAVEPKLGRVAYGVSNRVDRIKCLGNAVVPAVAQSIAKAIKQEGELI